MATRITDEHRLDGTIVKTPVTLPAIWLSSAIAFLD
jgi:hypothetical protein